jgi:hypothetical protein
VFVLKHLCRNDQSIAIGGEAVSSNLVLDSQMSQDRSTKPEQLVTCVSPEAPAELSQRMMAWLAEHVKRSEPRETEGVPGTEATVEAEIGVVWDWTSDMLIVEVDVVDETVVSMMSYLTAERARARRVDGA